MLLAHVDLEIVGNHRVRLRLLRIHRSIFTYHVIREGTVIAEGALCAQESLLKPLVDEFHKITASIRAAATRTARYGTENGFSRFIYLERNVIAQGLHPRKDVRVAVVYVGVRRDSADDGVGKVFCEMFDAVGLDEAI